MSQFSASWRVALRAGRRDVLRSKGRSALVAVMVGTPVLLTVMLTSLIASNNIDAREGIADTMGSSQALVSYAGTNVVQSPDGDGYGSTGEGNELKSAQQLAKIKSASDSTVIPVERGYGITMVIGKKGYSAYVLGLDASEPVTKGMYRLDRGRVPHAADEVLVSKGLASHGATIGSTITAATGKVLNVVGIGRLGTVARGGNHQGVLVLPGVLPVDSTNDFLIDRAKPVTWADVKVLNKLGFVVVSRDVLQHPPPASERYSSMQIGSGSGSADRAIYAIAVTAIVLEVILLAGPAFAVGVRRQRRDLALLAATGASPSQVRRVVLGQAIVLGILSCLLGAALGIGLSALAVRLGPSVVPSVAFGPFQVQWIPVAAAILLGSLAAVAAAFVPARQASKQQVAAVLAGRRGSVQTGRGWPLVGVLMIAASLALCFTKGTRQGGEIAVAASTVGIVMGTVFLTPMVIGIVARIGSVLPLPLRLAVRDTARQRSRSAPAIAAVMASVAGITTLAIASSSDFEQSRQQYQYGAQPGRLVVMGSPNHFDVVLKAASSAAGGTHFVRIGSAGTDQTDSNGVYASLRTSDGYSGDTEAFVADAATIASWGVDLDQQAKSALDAGQVLVRSPGLMKHGQARIDLEEGDKSTTAKIPAVVVDLGTGAVPKGPEPQLAGAVMTPATAKAHGIPWTTTRAISPRGAPTVSKAIEKRVKAAVSGIDPINAGATVERGFQESYALPFLALIGVGTLAVLIGTLTATGLALSDARPDFSTLAAVGAAPRTRRLVAGAQAIVLATLGALLGIAVGFAPGVAATWPLTTDAYTDGVQHVTGPVIQIPWLMFGVIIVAVPAVAALAAMLFTRSRLPVVRRLAQ